MIALEIDSSDDGQLYADLAGELDADNAPTLLRRLTSAYEAPADLLMNIERLEFIDSSGISVLLKVREMVMRSGGTFAVSGPTPTVRRVFDIAGLLEVFGLS